MIKTYTLKNIKKGIAIVAILTGFTSVQAQTTVDAVITQGAVTLDSDGEGGFLSYQSYATDEVVTMTGTATVAGEGSFDVTFTVTPGSGLKVMKGEDGSWGVVADTASALFRGNQASFCTISNITYSNFTGTLSESNIQSYTFTDAVIAGATNNQDRFTYQIGETEYISSSKFTENPATIDLRSYGTGAVAIDPALSSITTLIIRSGSTRTSAGSDAWSVQSLTVQVTLDDTTLGVNTINKNDKTLTIYPTVTDGAFYVNKEFDTLKIIDITGKTVKTFGASDVLEVSGLASGVYIVVIESKNVVATARIVVE
ncbi:hypothetical protein AXE80_07430 [Wenyingzhuangia fucanilytica]|uniref:Secretion system C-terminal sorting domain-containing protein n=1 Tax=Wenyingzhuangia fucanilytica TaxID=1790137 RepID=A0A1B1Y5U5_9FLAO|nr:T9SS type A sorting domain-containing protein [Wenyingzhuangia fucanilytica]ANW96117.1 hypothetical protein AXE80_07430 [Wenyingzhuangia fucanilytica]